MALLETLTDTFETGALDTTKWTDVSYNGTAVVSGGVLNLSTNSGGTPEVQSGTYTLGRLSQLGAKITRPTAGGTHTTRMAVLNPAGGGSTGESLIFLQQSTISCYTNGTQVFSATYDPVAHAWLRMRFDIVGKSVTTYFDASPDGVVWTQIYAGAAKTWTDASCLVSLQLAGGNSGAVTTTFDNVNITAPKTVASLSDDFLGTTLDLTKWSSQAGGGTVTVSGGMLQLATTSTASGSYAQLNGTRDYYSFIGSAAYARVTPSSAANMDTGLQISNKAGLGGTAVMKVSGTTVYILASNTSNTVILDITRTYNATTWAFWRIRLDAAGTTLYFDRSANAVSWTNEAAVNDPGWGRSTWVYLYAQNSSIASSPATSLVDSVNTLPAVPVNPTSIADPEALATPVVVLPVPVNPDAITDPETAGAPALAWSANPQPGSITDLETLATPTVVLPIPVNPTSIADPEALATPDVVLPVPVNPTSLTDPETVGNPRVNNVDPTAPIPDSITDPETLYAPDLSFFVEALPDTIADPETAGAPTVVFQPDELRPDGIAESETLADPNVPYTPTFIPDSASDTETLGQPTLPFVRSVGVDSLAEPELLAQPYLTFNPSQAGPLLPLADPEALGVPALSFLPSVINVVGINEAQALGAPSFSFIAIYNGAYSTGDYGVGPYQGLNFAPAGIVDPEMFGQPAIDGTAPVDPNTLLPLGIVDPETLAEPILPRLDATNWLYGAGIYDEGIYYSGGTGQTPDANPTDNVIYSVGTYGYGIYYGTAVVPLPTPPATPLFTNVAGRVQPPLHILGIGPWSPVIEWRGAPNYGVRSGAQPARPAMALPPASSKGFTLRLGDGGEARADLNFPRGSAVVIDEMDTDLWWRRKDPRTKELEMIGRFNTAHVSVSTSDTGVSCSVQFVDYRTVIGERMVLKYKSPKDIPPTSQWKEGTPVVDVLAWALPKNTRLDITAATGPDAVDLGLLTQTYELPPGTLISDLMDNMEALSPNSWEWWIETPVDIHLPPKLMFVIGERGKDKGVTLFDVGSGPTPIASWTRNAAADNYANSIYYSGGGTGTGADAGGGVVDEIPAQILQYGQRDVQDGNSSMYGGDKKALHARAMKKLEKYADRRPNYSIRLRQGFWRGRSHIDIGDTVTVFLRLGKEVLRDKYRVAEIAVDIDDNGMEDVTLSLGRLPTSADPRSKRSPLIRLVRTLRNFIPQGNGFIDPEE